MTQQQRKRRFSTTAPQTAYCPLPERLLAGMTTLGNGFLGHAANDLLRHNLATGKLSVAAYYRQLRSLMYRLLWLAVAERRNMLFTADVSAAMRQRYRRSYALESLCRRPHRPSQGQDGQRYHRLGLVMAQLGGHDTNVPLGLPVLQWSLWAPETTADLTNCALNDQDLMVGLQALLERIPEDIEHDGSLGAAAFTQLYTRLIEISPELDPDTQRLQLHRLPQPQTADTVTRAVAPDLLTLLLDTTLEPFLEQAMAQDEAEAALLAIKICDPCCGTGEVLLAAAQRVAQRLVRVRTGSAGTRPEDLQTTLYEVLCSCCYGVDPCELAVEVCQLTLAFASMAPGQSLTFLDQRIRCGHPGLGAAPDFLEQGIPTTAFTCLPGDQRRLAAALQRRNFQEQSGQLVLHFAAPSAPEPQTVEPLTGRESAAVLQVSMLADAWCAAFVWPKTDAAPPAVTQDLFRQLGTRPEHVPAAVYTEINRLAQQYRFFHWSLAFPEVFQTPQRRGFDVILGAWPWTPLTLNKRIWLTTHAPLLPPGLTTSIPQAIRSLAQTAPGLYSEFLEAHRQAVGTLHMLKELGFATPGDGGSLRRAAMLLKLSQRLIHPHGRVGCVVSSSRLLTDTTLCQEWLTQDALDRLYVVSNTARRVFTLSPAAAQCLLILRGSPSPQCPADVVWAIDQRHSVNEPQGHVPMCMDDVKLLSPNTHALPIFLTAHDAEITRTVYHRVPILYTPGTSQKAAWALHATPLWPGSQHMPLFLTRQQLEGEGWRLEGNRFRHGTETYLPVYDGTMFRTFDQRWGSYAGTVWEHMPATSKQNPETAVLPRSWVETRHVVHAASHVPPLLLEAYDNRKIEAVLQALAVWLSGHAMQQGQVASNREALAKTYHPVFQALPQNFEAGADAALFANSFPLTSSDIALLKRQPDALAMARTLIDERCPTWFLVWSSVVSPRSARAVNSSILPRVGLDRACYWLRLPTADARLAGCLLANLTSLVVDFCVQHKLRQSSLALEDFMQLPVLPPHVYAAPCTWSPDDNLGDWLVGRVLELVYTSWDLAPFAHDCGYDGPPFRWEDSRRVFLQSEIDAAYSVLYGLSRVDAMHLVAAWQQRQGPQAEALMQQTQLVVQLYDALQQASLTNTAYTSPLDPPPTHAPLAHTPRQTAFTPQLPFRYVTPMERDKFKTCLPLLSLSMVAAAFAEAQATEPEDWVALLSSRALRPGMFIAQMTGQAMHPVIPDGAYCLFERHMSGDTRRLHGRIVLVHSPALEDPETGENFAVRRYHWPHTAGRRASTRRPTLQLLPIHEAFAPLTLPAGQEHERHVIAELLIVLEAS